MTFRMRGHEEASGTKYVPQNYLKFWGKKDPVIYYENWLIGEGVLNEEKIQGIRDELPD